MKNTMLSWMAKLAIGVFLLSACTSAVAAPPVPTVPGGNQSADPTEAPAPTPIPTETALPTVKPTLLPDEQPPAGAQSQFKTDFSKHTVPYSDILSGGPPKDGIPAVDRPNFVTVQEADAWLKPVEPIVHFQIGDDVRAYPLQILMWHEIVNDLVGDVPVTITFCPLCNTAIAFERSIDGRVTSFGTTGRLRFSNLIMYDRATESWWQQATGEAIAGEFTGKQLTFLPASIIAWEDFKSSYPDGRVLSRDTGFDRSYGSNPYFGYDDVRSSPFLYAGPRTPDTLPAVARVLTVDLNGEAAAYPYDVLQEVRVVNDTVGGADIVVFWEAGTASALDSNTVAGGRDVGAAGAYSRELDGRMLTFSFDDSRIVDDETGSEWNVLGQAIGGGLAGRSLLPIVSINHFWFSWAAFRPETRVFGQ